MSCKHRTVEGRTTKYYYCKVLNKAVDDSKCENCMLKIDSVEDKPIYFLGGFKK